MLVERRGHRLGAHTVEQKIASFVTEGTDSTIELTRFRAKKDTRAQETSLARSKCRIRTVSNEQPSREWTRAAYALVCARARVADH